jgi:hypothetical protein
MLSDSCCDFISLYARKKVPAPAVAELLHDVQWYTRRDYPIKYPTGPGSLTDALRRATKRVLDHPEDEESLLWLLVLAETVRGYYDANLTFGDDVVGHWCAQWIREIEDFKAGRCPRCGHLEATKAAAE